MLYDANKMELASQAEARAHLYLNQVSLTRETSAALQSCTHLHKNLPSMDCTAVTLERL